MAARVEITTGWQRIYWLGGAAALATVLVGILEVLLQSHPAGAETQQSAAEWFALYQQNPFMGMRNLGLLNILLNLLPIPTYLALFGAHRRGQQGASAALALILAILGTAVFQATNRAFAMLELSRQYAVATATQQAALEAAGEVMLAVGGSHSPGTFLAFFLTELAGIAISLVLLRGSLFPKASAWAGIAGFSILLLVDIYAAFIGPLTTPAMVAFMFGGLGTMLWSVLVARRLLQLARQPEREESE